MSKERASQLVEAGIWLKLSGDLSVARRLFERALKLDPTNEKARHLLSQSVVIAPSTSAVFPSNAASSDSSTSGLKDERPETEFQSALTEPAFKEALDAAAAVAANEEAPSEVSAAPFIAASDFSIQDEIDKPASSENDVDHPPPEETAQSQDEKTPQPQDAVAAVLQRVHKLLELDDHTGVMALIKEAEILMPDSPEVQQLKERSERTMLAMYESKLGSLEGVPHVLLQDDEIIWLNLDHISGFILAQIDGKITFDDVFTLSGMSRLDTARILANLVERGVIGV